MSQLQPGSSTAADVGSVLSAVDSTPRSPTPILIPEQIVLFSTAAAISVPPATTGHRWPGASLTAAIGRILAPPAQRPHYPRREPNYLEAARMSRAMQRL